MTTTTQIWPSISRSLGFAPQEDAKLLGGSGVEHRFALLSVDEAGKRIFVISHEADPKVAGLIHYDVATNLRDYKLLTARPLAFNLQRAAREIATALGTPQFDFGEVATAFGQRMDLSNVQKSRASKAKKKAMAEAAL